LYVRERDPAREASSRLYTLVTHDQMAQRRRARPNRDSAEAVASGGKANPTPGSTVVAGPNANQCTVNLTGIPNARYTTVTLNGVTDVAGNSGPVSTVMGLLIGDVNGDVPNATGLVDSGDVFLVRQQTGQGTTLTNFRKDINASGLIDSGNVFLTRQRTGTQLPAPP
jgi:hypothetical protein